MQPLAADRLATPLGPLLAVADAGVLHLLEFDDDPERLRRQVGRLQRRLGAELGSGRTAPIRQLEGELRRYFDGVEARFETPLSRQATAFQLAVWDALCRIPPGRTLSYRALAAAAGRPAAIRAAGAANGANPFSIVVPCHRAIGSDGSLTRYGGGLERKRWLLEHERRWASA